MRDIVEVRAKSRVLDSPYSPKFPEGRVVDYPKYRQEAPVTTMSVTPLMSRYITPRHDLGRTVVSRSVTPRVQPVLPTSALKQTPTPLRENLSLWRLLRNVHCHHQGRPDTLWCKILISVKYMLEMLICPCSVI